MLHEVTYSQIEGAIEGLACLVGARQPLEEKGFVSAFRHGTSDQEKLLECATRIARALNLPISLDLTIGNTFKSRAMVTRRNAGKYQIAAQVSVPKRLPLFGTRELCGFRIQVTAGKNCVRHPGAFVVCMAHELSHILLKSLNSKEWENELHVDLVPLLLGFIDIATTNRTIQIGTNPKRFVTFGYLSDAQFSFASHRISEMLFQCFRLSIKLSEGLARFDARRIQLEKRIRKVRQTICTLERSTARKPGRRNAERLVQLFQRGFCDNAQRRVDEMSSWRGSIPMTDPKNEYYPSSLHGQMSRWKEEMDDRTSQADNMIKLFVADQRILNKELRLKLRLAAALGWRRRRDNGK